MDIPLEKDTTKIRPISGIPIATHPRVSPNPFRSLAGIRREPPGNPRKTRVHDPESTLSATPHGLIAIPLNIVVSSYGVRSSDLPPPLRGRDEEGGTGTCERGQPRCRGLSQTPPQP